MLIATNLAYRLKRIALHARQTDEKRTKKNGFKGRKPA